MQVRLTDMVFRLYIIQSLIRRDDFPKNNPTE